MERERPVSDHSLVNLPQGSRQYWEGQWDALTYCARVVRSMADQNPTSEQLKRLAMAIETKARMTATNKLGDKDDGQHA